MTRMIVACFVLGMSMAAGTGEAVAQAPAATSAPEPKMPPMPSMEGQQGDVSKPVTQIPPRKKSPVVEKKAPAVEKKSASAEKKSPPKAAPRKGH